jgi:hypothetical protein
MLNEELDIKRKAHKISLSEALSDKEKVLVNDADEIMSKLRSHAVTVLYVRRAISILGGMLAIVAITGAIMGAGTVTIIIGLFSALCQVAAITPHNYNAQLFQQLKSYAIKIEKLKSHASPAEKARIEKAMEHLDRAEKQVSGKLVSGKQNAELSKKAREEWKASGPVGRVLDKVVKENTELSECGCNESSCKACSNSAATPKVKGKVLNEVNYCDACDRTGNKCICDKKFCQTCDRIGNKCVCKKQKMSESSIMFSEVQKIDMTVKGLRKTMTINDGTKTKVRPNKLKVTGGVKDS